MDKKLTTVVQKNEGLEKMLKVLTNKNNKVEKWINLPRFEIHSVGSG